MELTSLELRILRGAAADLKLLKNRQPIPGCDRTAHYFGLQQAIDDARRGFERIAARRWLGEALSSRARMAVSRA
jgi:hypothetical protein